jgi:hypothetical protein
MPSPWRAISGASARTVFWTLALALLLAAGSCRHKEVREYTYADDIYPLAAGNEWVFSDRGGDGTPNLDRVRQVIGRTTFEGQPAWEVKEAAADGTGVTRFTARLTKQGLFVHPFDQHTRKDQERQELKFPMKAGTRWQADVQVFAGGRPETEPWVYVVRNPEQITVPAGTFTAVRIDAESAGYGTAYPQYVRTWYAPGVGVVRYQIGTDPEAKDRILELRRYKVN